MSGVRRFYRVQPHMPCTNSGTAHDPRHHLSSCLVGPTGTARALMAPWLACRVMISGHFVVLCRLGHDASTLSLAVLVANKSPEPTGSSGLTATVPAPRKDTTPRRFALAFSSGCPVSLFRDDFHLELPHTDFAT